MARINTDINSLDFNINLLNCLERVARLDLETSCEGICGLVHDEINIIVTATDLNIVAPTRTECYLVRSTSIEYLMDIAKKWPKYSGNPHYPVPFPNSISEKNATEQAEHAYELTDSLWVGEYGKLRRELLNFLIQNIEDKITNLKESNDKIL